MALEPRGAAEPEKLGLLRCAPKGVAQEPDFHWIP